MLISVLVSMITDMVPYEFLLFIAVILYETQTQS